MNPRGILLGALLAASNVLAQGATQSVSGVVRDSATGRLLAGAVIELRRDTVRRTAQSDEAGEFHLADIPRGLNRLTVRRLGFAARNTEIEVGRSDLTVSVLLVSVARELDTLYVRAGVTGIYGVVGSSEDLHPLAGAKVQVLGEDRAQLTDSAGAFFVPIKKGGTYVVRITRAGYVHRMFPIAVSGAVDASRLLDSAKNTTPGLEVLWQDFDNRLRWRGMNSALVSGSEVRRAGGSLIDAIEGSPSFASRGLIWGNSICVFLNGTPRPGLSLETIPIERVEVVEVYGAKDIGARALSWPRGALCGMLSRIERYQARDGPRANAVARWAVIWLKP